MEALRECVRMITASAGGCTTPFPFEAAIWLLEEQEELYGGAIPIYNAVRGRAAGTLNKPWIYPAKTLAGARTKRAASAACPSSLLRGGRRHAALTFYIPCTVLTC